MHLNLVLLTAKSICTVQEPHNNMSPIIILFLWKVFIYGNNMTLYQSGMYKIITTEKLCKYTKLDFTLTM
jgi:hypothetical protein